MAGELELIQSLGVRTYRNVGVGLVVPDLGHSTSPLQADLIIGLRDSRTQTDEDGVVLWRCTRIEEDLVLVVAVLQGHATGSSTGVKRVVDLLTRCLKVRHTRRTIQMTLNCLGIGLRITHFALVVSDTPLQILA